MPKKLVADGGTLADAASRIQSPLFT